MQLEYRLLNDDEIASQLATTPGWSVREGMLTRTFEFSSYKSGVDFAVRVADAADAMDHHPDLTIGYQKVTVAVNTHSVGGLSPYDFELARRVDAL